ncbi:MAG: DUF1232 domain-containing protein [Deltaproteobacteria bacterium]|nr:DUF1232 domain-containing protein [Deltaproteobacteria bacterium]
MLLDPKAPKLARALMIASLIYLVWPFDLLPDLIPLIGYLDDLGVVGLATAYLLKSLERYETTKRLAAGERIMDP